jgi:hypothetical protein
MQRWIAGDFLSSQYTAGRKDAHRKPLLPDLRVADNLQRFHFIRFLAKRFIYIGQNQL